MRRLLVLVLLPAALHAEAPRAAETGQAGGLV